MKRNIDLTENSDFATPVRNSIRFKTPRISSVAMCSCDRSILGNILHKNITDINYCIEEDIEYNQHGGIIQGNGYRRTYMKIINEPNSYCERCGRLKQYPWEDFSKLLCPKCDKEMDYEFNKIPWRRG